MKPQTVAALERLNREFYRLHGRQFSATRQSPWLGWKRVMEKFEDVHGESCRRRDHAILDVGCGNGRFGRYAATVLGPEVRYVGLDSSLVLLSEARRLDLDSGLAEGSGSFRGWRWVGADVAAAAPLAPPPPSGGGFCLVGVFGLLHHLPGESRRRRVLELAAGQLAPGGMLAVSFWQFGADERLSRRVISWSDHNDRARTGGRADLMIDPADLEAADRLLGWQGRSDPSATRFCHYADPAEAAKLIDGLDLELVESFSDDGASGALNLYFVLRRSPI